MLTAVIARPPVFGATLVSVDDSAARAVKGVTDVVQVPRGVAVLAEGFWAAKQGRDALQIEWDESTGETRSSARSEEHTSELQSLMRISYAVFCLKKQKHPKTQQKKIITNSKTRNNTPQTPKI